MREIFVFGSNLAGRHGAGAAKFARLNHGAIYGKNYGLQGNSFAIPTKSDSLETLSVKAIKSYVNKFIIFARKHPEMQFNLTPIGCGLAGHKYEDIAPLFNDVPSNIILPEEFKEVLNGSSS